MTSIKNCILEPAFSLDSEELNLRNKLNKTGIRIVEVGVICYPCRGVVGRDGLPPINNSYYRGDYLPADPRTGVSGISYDRDTSYIDPSDKDSVVKDLSETSGTVGGDSVGCYPFAIGKDTFHSFRLNL